MKTLLILSLLAFAFVAGAQTYSIDWHTISGGEATSTNSPYTVTGTIGQPEAGTAMSGGSFSLTGGFWSLISLVPTLGAPILTIRMSASSVIISWPATGSWSLQQSRALSGAWQPSLFTATQTNGTKVVTIANPAGDQFFRLH